MSQEILDFILRELKYLRRAVDALNQRDLRARKQARYRSRKSGEGSGFPRSSINTAVAGGAAEAAESHARSSESVEHPPKKRKLPPATQAAVKNGWAVWIDTHRELGFKDPIAVGQDTMASAQLAKAIPDRKELASIMRAYLEDQDRYIAESGHALRHLPSRVNKYRDQGERTVRLPAKEYDRMAAEMAKTGDAPPARFQRAEDGLFVNTEPLSDSEESEALGEL